MFLKSLFSIITSPCFGFGKQNTVQGQCLHGADRDMTGPGPSVPGKAPPCAFGSKRVYYPCGADKVRCVGGNITCAGTGEVVLSCAAVVLFSMYTISREYLFVNDKNRFLVLMIEYKKQFLLYD